MRPKAVVKVQVSKRKQKEALASSLEATLKSASIVLFNEFKGLTVAQVSGLRKACRAAGVEYVVVKNSVARRVLLAQANGSGEKVKGWLKGATALAVGRQDPVAAAKVLTKFQGSLEGALKIKGALFGKEVLEARQVAVFAALPSRSELLSRVAGGMKAPITRLHGVLKGVLRSLVVVMQRVQDQKKAS